LVPLSDSFTQKKLLVVEKGDQYDTAYRVGTPIFCQSGAALQEYLYYQKGYRQVTGKPYVLSEHHQPRVAA
jgi:hypothetical protein